MKKQVFVIEVNNTQNQNWQGSVQWVQGQKKIAFRSALELLRLMDSVVEDKKDEASV
ncbi:MAG: hypothetical protein Q4B57_08670 [Eubacteriales bacterium]|nr:hypothetical protein [Eubacteriales bacterium]